MSIFAGIVSRSRDQGVPNEWREELRHAVSRCDRDQRALIEHGDDTSFMLKVDVGAYREPGAQFDERRCVLLAGDPLLASGEGLPPPRAEGVARIADDILAGRHELLRDCRGQYCAAIYQKMDKTLHLVVDKLGVRPVYVWHSSHYVVFATAIRIIEALTFCRKELDMRGIAEIAGLGYALADRTAYKSVFSMRAGEHLIVDGDQLARNQYWNWNDLRVDRTGDTDIKRLTWNAFRDAIRIRLRGDTRAAAFLSGGLDSRSIAATLCAEGTALTTCNFAPPGSQDEVFGALAARRLNTAHSYLWRGTLNEDEAYSRSTVLEWTQSESFRQRRIERPTLFWSGDGGSVGLGHVYLNRRIVDASRAGQIDVAIREFLARNKIGIATHLLKEALAVDFQDCLVRGIQEELARIRLDDPGRLFYHFLMLNDQRRHLAGHFESLDLSRIDFHLPFFDPEFLACIMQQPVDGYLYHAFYVDWLAVLPDGVLDVPWQAYPGHVPCPVPAPAGLRYQWGRPTVLAERKSRTRNAVRRAREMLRDKAFSHCFLRTMRLRAFCWLIRLGAIEGREYLLSAPATLYRYWRRASGERSTRFGPAQPLNTHGSRRQRGTQNA